MARWDKFASQGVGLEGFGGLVLSEAWYVSDRRLALRFAEQTTFSQDPPIHLHPTLK